ncbi:hypothetical protein [uncultured Acetobacteroides sp.]|uniref:hypothetical protein n=1 Tax=uncultured Acetobacteroides sp. TaxID=1760811 RepID=UPI0029F50D72|nr:hypothetical protein [uncultured Acetobacteroides sp.]
MKKLLYLLALAVALGACHRESDLKKSIFIPDADDSRLPAYSEWGYNTFGAHIDDNASIYNDDVLIYNDDFTPLTIAANGSYTEFKFNGSMYDDYRHNEDPVTLIFRSTSIRPTTAEELIKQNGQIYQLNTSDFEVYLNSGGIPTKLTSVRGTLTFQRIQRVLVDKKYTEMILSGYFDLSGSANGNTISITDGRFDIGVKDIYNFSYQP